MTEDPGKTQTPPADDADDETKDMEQAQEDAAHERENEGGYQ